MATAEFERPTQLAAVFDLGERKLRLTLGNADPPLVHDLAKTEGIQGMVSFEYRREYGDGTYWKLVLTRVGSDDYVEYSVFTNEHRDKFDPVADPRNWFEVATLSNMPSTGDVSYRGKMGTRLTVEVKREDGTSWTF